MYAGRTSAPGTNPFQWLERSMTEQMTRPGETTPDARRLPLPVPRNAQGTLPLSSLQEQLWFLDRLAPGVRAYNVSRAFRVTGRVDVAALECAFADVVRRHET